MILDVTFLVDLARGDPAARTLLESLESGSEALRVPAPAMAKLWEALTRSRHPPREIDRIRGTLLAAPSAPFTASHGVRAGRLMGEAARDGLDLDPLDAMVAAMALEADESLVTRNVRDYGRIRDLRLRTY